MYDEAKDKTLWGQVSTSLGLEVKAVSYNGGPVKIQVSRFKDDGAVTGFDQATRVYQKLGRLTLQETQWVATALTAAVAASPVNERNVDRRALAAVS